MIEQARKIFDSYDPEPRFSGNRNGKSYKSGGTSLREKLLFAIERKKAQKNNGRHSLFSNGEKEEYGDTSLYST